MEKEGYQDSRHAHAPQPHHQDHVLLLDPRNASHSPGPREITTPQRREDAQIRLLPDEPAQRNAARRLDDGVPREARLPEEGAVDGWLLGGTGAGEVLLAGELGRRESGAVRGMALAALRAGRAPGEGEDDGVVELQGAVGT